MKMKFQFKKIIGMSSEYILEHKILNAIIVVGIIISFLSGILNYLTRMPVISVYGSFFIAIAYVSILLYSVLSKNFIRSYYLIFGFIITVFAPVFWVINGGSLGTTLYFLILTLVLMNITSKNNANIFFSIAMIIVIAILLIIEKNYPQIIIDYPINEDRLIDIFVSILLVAAAIIISLKLFMNIYRNALDSEREQKNLVNQEEEKFRRIVNSLPQFISIWDLNMRCTYVSPAVQHLTGYTPEERIATDSEVYMAPESMARLRNGLMDALAQEEGHDRDPNLTVTYELEQIRKDGSRGTFESTYAFLRNETGAPVSVLAVTADITERKQVEKELKEAKEAAESANRSKSVFLANMSHEIRTPMNAILGFSQLMQRDTSLSPQSREHLDIVNRSGEHLLAMINDILEMSKIEAGRSVFNPTTFDLHTLLYDIERMFRLRTDDKGLRFLMEKVGQVPRWVKTDEGKLRQVLINLLGNSVKFTDEGGIVLRICGKAENTDKLHLKFEMEDTGPGMSDDEIGHLFQAFEQTRSGIKSGGTGLGLALSQGFVKIMGGTISVTSTPGKGSIFRFNIPVQKGSEENDAKKEAKQRVLCLKPVQNEIRILIADDTETNRQLLLQLLAAVEFATNQAVNGEDAIRMVHEWKPHLVLMDMTMPVMDGYEATRKIKASPDTRNTAIVALTASAFEEDKKRILDAGADGYLSKPFKDEELFETIGRLTGAEYLYEEAVKTEAEKISATADDKVLMRKTVAALPRKLVDSMRAAVESADLDLLNELALQVAAQQPLLAKQIQEMAARYEYDALSKLFSATEIS